MAENIDDLTIQYVEDDKVIIKEENKNILTRGNWTTIMYLFRELDKKTDAYGAPKVSIRRYQKRNGVYRQQSKFNISSAKQGREIIKTLNEWFPLDSEPQTESASSSSSSSSSTEAPS